MNYEEGRMWTVQGYRDDETVHAYPTVCSALANPQTPPRKGGITLLMWLPKRNFF
jgi:hypothetical protein